MEIGIAGPPGSGKTTVFNALTRSHAQTGGGQRDPHRAVVKVPDPRVDALSDIFHPKSIKYADVEFVDVAGLAKGSGAESEAAILGHLRTVDALALVVPAFASDVGVDGFVADLVSLGEDLVLADLAIVEKRHERLEREVRMGARALHAGEVIQASYRLLDLISFLTAGEDECRAWPIRRGSTALDAAGTIHSDLARGFIRAEVVAYDDFIDAGSTAEARKRGKLRSEGKTYVVQDGDVMNILFNV